MPIGRQRLWRSRVKNSLQTLLIMGGLALVLAVPGYLLAGGFGIVVSLGMVVAGAFAGSWVPARYILADAGAGLLDRHQAPSLYRLLDTLYKRAGLTRPPQLFYAPSPDLNAFAVGTRHDGGIAVTEGLLRTLTLRELAGVLAHEVSHLRHGDTRVMSMAAAMTRLTLWLTTVLQLSLLLMVPLILAGELRLPWGLLLVVAFAPSLSTLLQLALSRNREYTADLDAVSLTGDPEGLASALAVLERHHGRWLATLFGRHPPAGLDWLRTHPPTEERIRRLMTVDEPPQPPLHDHHEDHAHAPPVILERPGAMGRRYWMRRRR
ncbi:zinc metalloprotease HtpX [Halomonas rhizosphaerae]|uniref:Zinc metalloprotease HtpX n=1 Tax=Halomonas rhizosphaerae TaxID=3043296 RepID=A0ABT6UVI8_9GAMM|nr:zinc metalloprotease HtpX [Halomonas rhizosphaerae]MDI5889610.1 zinc metalloprotease HtpX [Halomonas rhizosphaerae]